MAEVGTDIYREIGERTGGDVYVGVVGPVRTGKSTFIKRFMESSVIPNITDENERRRATDEVPQSAGGKTVMTTEPKFVPDEAVRITLSDGSSLRVKMVDCVGYLVPGAMGDTEDGEVRMVLTPWSDEPMPFEEAAEEGTRRVIEDHSTIAFLVTTDGSFGDLSREAYVDAERRVVEELHRHGKPFAVILNSSEPASERAEALALSLEEEYGAPVALVSCIDLDSRDTEEIMRLVLSEFPIRELSISFPDWTGALDDGHRLKTALSDAVKASVVGGLKAGQAGGFAEKLAGAVTEKIGCETGPTVALKRLDMGSGAAEYDLSLSESMFYRVVGDVTGLEIENEEDLLASLKTLSQIKREYDKFADAIDEVNEKGYGIVMPGMDDLTLDEPQIVKQAGGYGLKLRAAAPSIHLIRAGIETELNPIVGTEEQSEDLVKYLLHEFEDDPRGIWDTDLFGKSIYELVNEGLHAKLDNLPDDARDKFGQTISRVINEGSRGLICIIL